MVEERVKRINHVIDQVKNSLDLSLQSDSKLARKIGVAAATITRWRQGRMPNPSNREAFANALGILSHHVLQYIEGEIDDLPQKKEKQKNIEIPKSKLQQILEWLPSLSPADLWELGQAIMSLSRPKVVTIQDILHSEIQSHYGSDRHRFANDCCLDIEEINLILNGDRPSNAQLSQLSSCIESYDIEQLVDIVRRQYNGKAIVRSF